MSHTKESGLSIYLVNNLLGDNQFVNTIFTEFYANGEVTTEQKVTISSEKALWEGHHYVSWDKADGDPNKSFNLIPQEVMTSLKPGTILRVIISS